MKKRISPMEFYDATIDAVAEVGLENFRTKMVGERTQYSEASLYNLFGNPGKDNMLCQTFLEVDRRTSAVLLESSHFAELQNAPDTAAFLAVSRAIWEEMYDYLLSHKNETLFLLRFRYSALYPQVRSQRQAYNGAFAGVNELLRRLVGAPTNSYEGYLPGLAFELTLINAEKVVTGRLPETPELRDRVWNMVVEDLKIMIRIPDKAEGPAK